MKRLIMLLLFVGLLSQPLFAADAAMVTDVGTSAKMLSLGQVEGFDNSAISILENPAALYRVDDKSLSVFSTTLFSEVEYRNLAYAAKVGKGTLAVGYMSSLNADQPKTASENGEFVATEYFDIENFVVKAGYQHPVSPKLHVGAALNYYSNTIYTVKGTGYNMDLGMIYLFDNHLEASVSFKNILTHSKANYSNGGRESYPLQTVWGMKYGRDYYDVMAQVKTTTAHDHLLKSLGVHYNPGFLSMFHLNFGYKEYVTLDEVANHYTTGVGLDLYGLRFDYAYEKSDHLLFDNNNYFSISFDF